MGSIAGSSQVSVFIIKGSVRWEKKHEEIECERYLPEKNAPFPCGCPSSSQRSLSSQQMTTYRVTIFDYYFCEEIPGRAISFWSVEDLEYSSGLL